MTVSAFHITKILQLIKQEFSRITSRTDKICGLQDDFKRVSRGAFQNSMKTNNLGWRDVI